MKYGPLFSVVDIILGSPESLEVQNGLWPGKIVLSCGLFVCFVCFILFCFGEISFSECKL